MIITIIREWLSFGASLYSIYAIMKYILFIERTCSKTCRQRIALAVFVAPGEKPVERATTLARLNTIKFYGGEI
jgi:hypothetical protein